MFLSNPEKLFEAMQRHSKSLHCFFPQNCLALEVFFATYNISSFSMIQVGSFYQAALKTNIGLRQSGHSQPSGKFSVRKRHDDGIE